MSTTPEYGTPLTPRELLVLEVMATAFSEADAAARLGVSAHTVHSHLRNARSRLGVRTTREAVFRIVRLA